MIIWGCPALRAGRAIAQLAGLLGPAALRALVCRLRRPCYSPSARFNCAALAIVCYEFLARPAIF
ncbi:hypothetical protein SGRA_2426 [Saprospira grandis str. Lewin]|uniref:Uncharacterized protein n=1 Tax=Saprospira grandis (strain Lewin) TaxID=984262 RepID=H6L4X9_SAPGL|nr:hypothetical protein SGRA_2426 [Saprospira grandis str. Lewin]